MEPNEPVGQRTLLFQRLIWLTRKHHQRCDVLLERHGIGSGQVRVLLTLDHHRQMTQRELAERMHITPATVSGTLKRMEKAGIIARAGREEDARISVVTLTEAGKALIETARQTFDQVDSEVFEGFSQKELDVLDKLLGRMQENMRNMLDSSGHCAHHHFE